MGLPTRKEISDALDALCEATDELPEDWRLSLHFTRGELNITLWHPEGMPVEYPDGEDDTPAEMVAGRVDFARQSDGLGPAFGKDDL